MAVEELESVRRPVRLGEWFKESGDLLPTTLTQQPVKTAPGAPTNAEVPGSCGRDEGQSSHCIDPGQSVQLDRAAGSAEQRRRERGDRLRPAAGNQDEWAVLRALGDEPQAHAVIILPDFDSEWMETKPWRPRETKPRNNKAPEFRGLEVEAPGIETHLP